MLEQDPQRYPELASFGEELRREREIRGISLKEIADATKISKRFLEAIERNDHRTLPAPVFTRGFVREYSRYLGLNAEEIVNRYNFAAAGDDRIEKTPHMDRLVAPPPIASPVAPPRKRGIPPAYARIDGSVFLVLLIIAILGGVTWWAIQHRRAQARTRSTIDAGAPIATAATTSTRDTRVAPQTVTGGDKPLDDTTLKMIVEATDASWVTLEADGETVLNGQMALGERREFQAKDRFRFKTIGNAAGITLTLNSTQIPPLGEDGEVVKNRSFTRESLEAIRREENAKAQ
jgi:cytoskeletal protein RodZ